MITIDARVAELCAGLRWTPERLRCRCRTDEYVAYRIVVARALALEMDAETRRPRWTWAQIAAAMGRDRSMVWYYVYRAELPGIDERRK